MKIIYIVFNNREKGDVLSELLNNLKFVFEGYIKVKICFLNEIQAGDISDGDLFIVLYKDRVYAMKDYISSMDKVIVMSRTIQRKFLPEVFAIPEGTAVLVVNDSDESTLQTVNNLYELGLNYLNLIPYIQTEDLRRYEHIRISITPDEEKLVPPFIEKTINIQNRHIAMDTFVTIINKLKLNNEQITRNLIRYNQLIAESGGVGNRQYVTERLKSEILKKIIQNSERAILITDEDYRTVYVNDKARFLFHIDDRPGVNLEEVFAMLDRRLLEPFSYDRILLSVGGINYLASKRAAKIVDQVVGYYIIFEDEKEIKKTERDLNKQLVKSGLVAKYHFDQIVGESSVMKKSVNLAKKVALTDFTVLIGGESGTGKELFAQSIHNFSSRRDQPFVAINCAALPESLLESELFGYEKGAFTGALSNGKLGLFEQAGKGTVFLDEIGDMPLSLQARLLRVLQEKQIMRLGSDKIIDVNIRIIAATNKNLEKAIREGTFREDLYFRLCNIPITLPPLREREEDILLLMEKNLGDLYQTLSSQEKMRLLQYDWPGNVRELKNVADYFITLGELPAGIMKKTEDLNYLNGRHYPSNEDSVPGDVTAEKTDSVDSAILELIACRTREHSGIGRDSLLKELKKQGILISDNRLRKILKKLESNGKIVVGKGRSGCRIT